MTLKELRDYVRTHKLNKPDVRLGMNKPELIAGLKKIRHWEERPKVKKTNTKLQSKGVLQIGKKPKESQRIDTTNKNKGKVLKSEPKKEKVSNQQAGEDEVRIDIYGKGNIERKRVIVKEEDTLKKVLSIIDDMGYSPTKQQKESLGDDVNYLKGKKGIKGIDIKRGMGKTDMIIVSVSGHKFGSGAASVRIKKKK